MASLLIRSIRYLVTCDDKDQLLEDVDLYCEDGFIRQIGPHLDVAADRTIDASHMLVLPRSGEHPPPPVSGLLPQPARRCRIWSCSTGSKPCTRSGKIWTRRCIRLSSLTGMGELLKHGCTTCFDHHYVFPARRRRPDRRPVCRGAEHAGHPDVCLPWQHGSQRRRTAACRRTAWCRRWMRFMTDSARLIEKYHDTVPRSHAPAWLWPPALPSPCRPELLRQSAHSGPPIRRAAAHPPV